MPTPPRLSRHPSVLITPSDDGYVAYDLRSERLLHLNPAAALVVELCDGTPDRAALRELLLPLVGEAGWAPCDAWIGEALETGLLMAGEAVAPDPRVGSAKSLTALASQLRDDDQVMPAFVCQWRASELAPEDPKVWYRLGELAHIVGRRDVARDAYERYHAMRPDDAEIAHILRALRGEPMPERAPDQFIEQLYSRFASFYDRNMSQDLDYRGPTLIRQALEEALGDRKGLEVLDLGCGTGLSADGLKPFARRLVGVDLSEAMLEKARARGVYDELHLSELTLFLAQPDLGRFDVIAACDTLIYFGDLTPVMAASGRHLRPGGVMVLSVERGEQAPFALTDAGRFAHHPDHIAAAARMAGLTVRRLDAPVIRYEYGKPVQGLVAVLSSPS